MTNEKVEYLNRYTLSRNCVELITDYKVISELPIPEYWKKALYEDDFEKRKGIVLSEWRRYVDSELSNTILYLETYLKNIELMKIGESYSLLYTLTSYQTEETCYYEGKNPLSVAEFCNKVSKTESEIDSTLLSFYTKIHDGFYYYPSKTLGLDSSNNIDCMADFDWDYEEQLNSVDLKSCYNFFSNGMGIYVVLDLNQNTSSGAYIWSSREIPRGNLNFWDLVDEWIILGLDF